MMSICLMACDSQSAPVVENKDSTEEPNMSFKEITQAEAKNIMDNKNIDALIIDVRRPDEYAEGHIKDAINIPNESIIDTPPIELPDKDKLILVYCRSGRRSKDASGKLANMGYTNINEFGGIIDWPYGIIVERDELNVDEQFFSSEIPDDIFEKMQGKSFKDDCTVEREELRYLHVLHVGFDGNTHEGEIICNKQIADNLLSIFKELYDNKYEIEKIKLIDEYDADDESSMRDNNSSCFNFRFISHSTTISNHGLGLAVDINPLYNPYIKTVNGKLSIEPANAGEYVDRTADFEHKIDENDLCYKLFIEHGFTWGGSWKNSKDYQHFEYRQ